MNPKVSILLPFFNAGDMLNTAIESIIAQTFADWELLLINNNSTDVSLKLAQKWCGADARIQLLHEPVQGIAYALNQGLAASKGRYIARMDADDLCAATRLQNQFEYLEQHADIDVLGCCCTFRSQLEQSSGYARFVNWQNQIISTEEHAVNRFIESPLAHPSVMFRKNLVESFGAYSTDAVPEDYELWLRWMEKGVRFAKLPQPLLQWNDHAQRLSRQHSNYSDDAFYHVKCFYLARHIKQHIDPLKKVVICGTGKLSRARAQLLEAQGVPVFGFTDVRNRELRSLRFLSLAQLNEPEHWLLLNFISKQGVNQSIRSYLLQKGYREMVDFILAA